MQSLSQAVALDKDIQIKRLSRLAFHRWATDLDRPTITTKSGEDLGLTWERLGTDWDLGPIGDQLDNRPAVWGRPSVSLGTEMARNTMFLQHLIRHDCKTHRETYFFFN